MKLILKGWETEQNRIWAENVVDILVIHRWLMHLYQSYEKHSNAHVTL